MKTKKKPNLSKSMKAAGVVSIGSRNLNGSYTCQVRLDRVNVGASATNFRTYDQKHMKDLNNPFLAEAMRNPLLSYRSGRRGLGTIDGRHTLNLLRWLIEQGVVGKDEYAVISCDVFFNITDQQAAAVFHHLTQNSKRMDPWSAFYAAVVAKFPHAVAIRDLIDAYEFTTPVDEGPPPRQGADLNSIEPFLEAYRRTGDDTMVENLLWILRDAFTIDGDLEPTAGMCSFIRGLIDLLRRYGDVYEMEYIIERLAKHDADDYRGAAFHAADKEQKRLDRRHYRIAFEDALLTGRERVRLQRAA